MVSTKCCCQLSWESLVPSAALMPPEASTVCASRRGRLAIINPSAPGGAASGCGEAESVVTMHPFEKRDYGCRNRGGTDDEVRIRREGAGSSAVVFGPSPR